MEQLIERAAYNLAKSKYAIALTGAGISTESGIADFRGPQGIWTKNPEAERKAYRSYQSFLENPKAWWHERLKSTSLLGDLEKTMPNPGHYALAELERMGILKSVITQNVDGLHTRAGTRQLLEYHGGVLKLRCVACTARFQRSQFDLEKLSREDQLPPACPHCGGIVKTDGVAFGEPIPRDVAHRSLEEALKCDLMLICGTSAVVYPFADLPRIARQKKMAGGGSIGKDENVETEAPAMVIIEINADPTPLTAEGISNYLIRGKTGQILPKIVAGLKGLKNRKTIIRE